MALNLSSAVLSTDRSPPHPLSALFLGADWKQRLRTRRSLIGGLGYLVVALLLFRAANSGTLPLPSVQAVAGAMAALVFVLYVVLRSGLNRRFRDPSLTMIQMLAPATMAGWIYTFSGPWRDAILVALVPVLLFGFMNLSPLKTRLLSGYSLASIGVAFIIRAAMGVAFGHQQKVFQMPLVRPWRVFDIRVHPNDLMLSAVALGALAIVFFILHATPMGRRMRAVADDASLARVSGISPQGIAKLKKARPDVAVSHTSASWMRDYD